MLGTNRIKRELEKLSKIPNRELSLCTVDESLKKLQATISGPKNTPYDGGQFQLEISIPDNYPIVPPLVKFTTKVYHPNIDNNGRICLDLLKLPPSGAWKPTVTLEAVLIALHVLLGSPNPHDPLMVDIAEEYIRDRSAFELNARKHTSKHAVK